MHVGGAIFDEGGQLKVVNSAFTGDNCYASGPDLGGGAIRAVGMCPASPVYITHDTFSGNSSSNGGALSGLYAHFDVINSVLTGNKAVGWGANPAKAGTPGGGTLTIDSSTLQGNASGEFQNAPGIFDSVNGQDTQPVVVGSSAG